MAATSVERMLPLYEAKMIHHYDHRWATYERNGSIRDATETEKQDPEFVVMPRYWVPEDEVESRLAGRWDHDWLLGWRDICRSTDERTTIAAAFPCVAVGHTLPLILGEVAPNFAGALSSLVFDYVTRQKVGGTHLTYNYLMQLPMPDPTFLGRPTAWSGEQSIARWIDDRVSFLISAALDVPQLGEGSDGIREWNSDERAEVRAELDAAFFHLYGVERADVDYILDTFPILRRKDEQAFGEYRTKRRVLEIFDAMAQAAATGAPYRSVLPERASARDEPGS